MIETNTISLPFNVDLLNYLKKEGYSHIYNLGIRTPIGGDPRFDNNYLLIPFKPNDPRLQYDDDLQIETINGNDVAEMAAGVEHVNFMIELTSEEGARYLKL